MKRILFGWTLFSLVIAGGLWAQEPAYTFSTGPGAWGLADGSGLIGMGAQIERDAVGLEIFWGVGTNRVQGWGLWPRAYLSGPEALWRPFGELALVQVRETEILFDPERGLSLEKYTWQFMGVGLGASYRQGQRRLRASAGLGVTGGQCAACAMKAYAALQFGFSFAPAEAFSAPN